MVDVGLQNMLIQVGSRYERCILFALSPTALEAFTFLWCTLDPAYHEPLLRSLKNHRSGLAEDCARVLDDFLSLEYSGMPWNAECGPIQIPQIDLSGLSVRIRNEHTLKPESSTASASVTIVDNLPRTIRYSGLALACSRVAPNLLATTLGPLHPVAPLEQYTL